MSTERRIRVLLVEDSRVEQQLLGHILTGAPGIALAGVAGNGEEALVFLEKRQAQVDMVLMDIHMPRLDGYEATRQIMATSPLPVVLISGAVSSADRQATFRALEVGALALLDKPLGPRHAHYAARCALLLDTIRAMAEVKVVRRRPGAGNSPHLSTRELGAPRPVALVAIGASTGGPVALQRLCQGLPPSFPAPLVVVQHLAAGFHENMAQWLGQTGPLPVALAKAGERPLPGHLYLAPDGSHLTLATDRTFRLSDAPPEFGLRPTVAQLFRSVAQVYGTEAVGVLLTGMGRDGAAELGLMRKRGALTIAQDRDSSIVFGMPHEAIALGAASLVLPLERIAEALCHACKHGPAKQGSES